MSDKYVSALQNLEHEFKNGMNTSKEAIDRINAEFSEIKAQLKEAEKAAARASIASSEGLSADDVEAKAAFTSFLRSGRIEQKTMNATLTGTDGGMLIPRVIYNQIQRLLVDISPMRSVARVLTASTADFRLPVSTGGTTSSWVGDTTSRPATTTSSVTTVSVPIGELSLLPVASKQLVEDAQFDITSYIAQEVATEVARAEGAAFVNGTGAAGNQPAGFLSPTLVATADATRAFGQVEKVLSGTTAQLNSDDIINLVYKLKQQHRSANCAFIMPKLIVNAVRSMKNSYGEYLWSTNLVAGQPDTLLGYPIYESEDMDNTVATGKNVVPFGNWNAGYCIADRIGAEVLVNPYITPGFITFQTRMRVGGTPLDTQAYKVLQIK